MEHKNIGIDTAAKQANPPRDCRLLIWSESDAAQQPKKDNLRNYYRHSAAAGTSMSNLSAEYRGDAPAADLGKEGPLPSIAKSQMSRQAYPAGAATETVQRALVSHRS